MQLYEAQGAEQPALVIQTLAGKTDASLAAEQTLLAVIQLIDVELHVLVGTNDTAAIVRRAIAQGQQILARDATTAVIQTQALQGHQALGLHAAAALVVQQSAETEVEITVSHEAARLTVIQTGGADAQPLPGP
ncbi:hypothetical protein D3C84_855530 [compost metagenome]